MSLNKNIFTLLVLLFGVVVSAQRQGNTKVKPHFGSDSTVVNDLDEVVITATRTIRQLSSLPLPVILISQEQLKETGVMRLNEILNEQTGIVMTPDVTTGGGEGVQIQGVAADYVMVLIDGVPVVGRSSGNLDLSRFAIGNIKQIEIVKGPSSSLFGSEALGGVINIITEKPTSSKLTGGASYRIGQFNSQNINADIQQRLEHWDYALFFDRLWTDGYDLSPASPGQTVNPYYNNTFNGRVNVDFSDSWKLFGSGRYFYQEFDLDPDYNNEKDMNAHLRLDNDPSDKANFQYELYYTNYVAEEFYTGADASTEDFVNDFDHKLFRPEVRFNYAFIETGTMTLGVGYTYEHLSRSLFEDNVSVNSQYVYGQYDFKPLDKLNIIAGARFDHHSVYQSQLSPKLSAKYDLTDRISVKGSVGSGFKAPDFRQLYLDFTNASGGGYSVFGKEVEKAGIERLQDQGEINVLVVDPNELGEPLDAESSVGYNFGATYRYKSLSAELNFFRNDFKNLIDTRILANKTNGQSVFGYINRERVYTQGMEVDVKYYLFDNLKLSGGYQFLLAYDKDKKDDVKAGDVYARDPQTLQTVQLDMSDYFGLENRSRHTVNFKAFYEVPQWESYANLRVVYRSEFGLTDTNGNDLLDVYDSSYVDGYALVNMAVGKTFFSHAQVQLGVNNLLNYTGHNPLGGQDDVQINPGVQWYTKISVQF